MSNTTFSFRSSISARKYLPTSTTSSILQLPVSLLSWLMVKSFGIKLVYPGSIGLMQSALAEPLQTGREKWVLEKKGIRYKIEAVDGNHIDAMFFDRRPTSNSASNGRTLVVSCEGNAGFYEIGVLSTPMDAGYSVLGWNHPGFGGSTGKDIIYLLPVWAFWTESSQDILKTNYPFKINVTLLGSPFPEQETNAVDAVLQFAILRLGFTPDKIIIHGWSIGGFPSSWAAMNYPDIKAVVCTSL